MRICLTVVLIITLLYLICRLVRARFSNNRKLVDCFSYNGEIKSLRLRLKELYDYVDHFIIVECPWTFSGLKKELKYPQDKQQLPRELLDKITYIVHDNNNPKDGAWERERKQKNSIFYEGIKKLNLSDNDYVIYSDADEIPDMEDVQTVIRANSPCMQFNPGWFNFTLNNYLGPWQQYSIWLYKYGYMKKHFKNSIRGFYCEKFPKSSGWHLSYFFPPEQILQKLKSYAHFQDTKDLKVINGGVPYIIERIKEGGELFGAAKRQQFKGKYPKYVDDSYFRL